MPNDKQKTLRIGWYASGNIYDLDAPQREKFLFWDVVLDYIDKGYKVVDSETGKEMTRDQVKDHIDRRY